MTGKVKKLLDWCSAIDTICSITIRCITQFNIKDVILFLFNNPKLIPLVVLVFAGLAYGFLRLCGFTYVAVLNITYHLAGVKDGSHKLNPILRGLMIVVSLSVLGLSVAIVGPSIYYLQGTVLQTCILIATFGFIIAGLIGILMCGLPNSFVQKHFKVLFRIVVISFTVACTSYSILAVYQLLSV